MIKFSDSGDPFDKTVVNCIVYLKIKGYFLKLKSQAFFLNTETEVCKFILIISLNSYD